MSAGAPGVLTQPPRLGLYLDMRNPPAWTRPWSSFYSRWLEIIEEADRRGAGAVWIAEHHGFEDGYIPQPLTLAAAVAARTRQVRIGTAVLLGALRHPRHIAEEAAVVDLISGGRLDLGFGGGYRQEEYAAFGADFDSRSQTVRRRVQETQDLLSTGMSPPSVQQPIPLWGGFRGPVGARFAGRLGLGLLDAHPSTFGAYLAGLEAGGHPPERARLAHPANFLLAADPEAAWARIAPHYAYTWRTYLGDRPELDPSGWVGRGQCGVDLALPSRSLSFRVLTPEAAAASLQADFSGLPLTHVFCWASIGGMDDDLVTEHITLLTGELTERLKGWAPGAA